MNYEQWWWQFTSEHDEWRFADSEALRKAAFEAGQESMQQQLAERDEQISDLTVSSDTYFAERNSARDVWRRASKDRDELRQQLSAALDELEVARNVANGNVEAKFAAWNQLAEMEEQLGSAQAACKHKDDAMLAVLCDPEGSPCFAGSDGDRKIIADALAIFGVNK
jgi:chromosome segregation ATPase